MMKDCATAALEFAHVTYRYAARDVVAGVTAHIHPGEMVGLLGPNGAGKSTLLRLAAGLLRPRQGVVRVAGRDAAGLARREAARRIAFVPQEFTVQFAYTVRQVVELGRTPHLGALGVIRPADTAAVSAALKATHVEHLAGRIFNALSGGERQRVLLALALAQESAMLLLDEPTAHLDIKHQIGLLDLLTHLNAERGLTVVAALHDLNLAARYFPRLMLLRTTLVADGPPAAVLDPALLSDVYETPVQVGVLRGEHHLSVLPAQSGEPGSRAGEGSTVRVQVLAGGGSGELLMRALADAGIAFGAGPLNVGDSDDVLARRLAATSIIEPPYAPVSDASLAELRQRAHASDVLIVCPLPIGPGNVALLDIAVAACAAGTPVLLWEPRASDGVLDAVRQRDYTGRAADLYQRLLGVGAEVLPSPAAMVARIQAIVGARDAARAVVPAGDPRS